MTLLATMVLRRTSVPRIDRFWLGGYVEGALLELDPRLSPRTLCDDVAAVLEIPSHRVTLVPRNENFPQIGEILDLQVDGSAVVRMGWDRVRRSWSVTPLGIDHRDLEAIARKVLESPQAAGPSRGVAGQLAGGIERVLGRQPGSVEVVELSSRTWHFRVDEVWVDLWWTEGGWRRTGWSG